MYLCVKEISIEVYVALREGDCHPSTFYVSLCEGDCHQNLCVSVWRRLSSNFMYLCVKEISSEGYVSLCEGDFVAFIYTSVWRRSSSKFYLSLCEGDFHPSTFYVSLCEGDCHRRLCVSVWRGLPSIYDLCVSVWRRLRPIHLRFMCLCVKETSIKDYVSLSEWDYHRWNICHRERNNEHWKQHC